MPKKGVPRSEETKEKIRLSSLGRKHTQETNVLKRDDNKCQICFDNLKLQIHHLDGDKKNNKINNLITLCYECHRKLHAGIL